MDIDVRDEMADGGSGFDLLGPADKEWNLIRRAVPLILAVETMFAHVFSMVRGENDNHLIENALCLKALQNASDVIVDTFDEAAIMRFVSFQRFFISLAFWFIVLG